VLATEVEACEAALRRQGGPAALGVAARLGTARGAFLDAVGFVLGYARKDPAAVFAGAVPYLRLTGELVVGWQLARALLAAERHLAEGRDPDFMRAKIVSARFFADHVLTQAPALRDRVVEGAASVVDLPLDSF
jgi:hypothetical protein